MKSITEIKSTIGDNWNIVVSVFVKAVFLMLPFLILPTSYYFIWLVALILFWEYDDIIKKKREKEKYVKACTSLLEDKDMFSEVIKDLPSWVTYPNVHRAEWLNKIFKQLWPNTNQFIEKKLRTSVQEKIKKNFDSFRFRTVDFGYTTPKIKGVQVYNYKEVKNEIIIDFDIELDLVPQTKDYFINKLLFRYDGSCDISFSVYGIQGSIKDFRITAELRIVLKPLMPKLPLVGGLQIFFLNVPEIDFDVQGIARVPGFKSIFRRRILKLTDNLVFPNRIPVKLSKSLDNNKLASIEPEGVLRVHVIQAKNLEKKDSNVLGKGKSDPYATITVGAQSFKTKVIPNVTCPVWDYWCEFYVLDSKLQHLDIEVFDEDLSNDDFLGNVLLDIHELIENGDANQWINLENVKHGKINLQFSWLTLSTSLEDLEFAVSQENHLSTALLTVFVDDAKNIPLPGPHRKPNPAIVLTVGTFAQETKAKKNCTEASWGQGFSFLLPNPKTDALFITVMDGRTNIVLDDYSFNVGSLLDEPNLEAKNTEFTFEKGTVLRCSLELRILKDSTLVTDNVEQMDGQVLANDGGEIYHAEQKLENTNNLVHRSPSYTSSAGDFGLGRVQLTLRYSEPRQKLIVVVHQLANLSVVDDTDEVYINLCLIPGSTKTKQKTKSMWGRNPVFDETIEFSIAEEHLAKRSLSATVKIKSKRSMYNKVIGQVCIGRNLSFKVTVKFEGMILTQSYTSWFDLCNA